MIVNLGIVGEGHGHHIDQRSDRKDRQRNNGRSHQEGVNIAVKQSSHIFLKGVHMLAGLLHAQSLIAAPYRPEPQQAKNAQNQAGSNTVQQNQLGLMACGVFINTLSIIPDLTLLQPAQAGQHGQPVNAALRNDQEDDHSDFNCHVQQTLDHLTGHNVAQTKEQAGKPDDGAAIFQRITQRIGIGILFLGRCGFCQFFC